MQAFYYFIYFFEAFVAYLYFSDNYKEKTKKWILFSLLFILYTTAFAINVLGKNNSYINEITILLINFAFSKLCFDISIKSSIFHSSFLMAIMLSTELITEYSLSYLFHIPIDAYRNSFTALIIVVLISKTLYFFVCKLVSHFFSYKKISEVDFKRTSVLFLYPIMVSGVLTTLLYASVKYDFSKGLNMACVILSLLSILFCCFIFIYNRVVQKQENELINLQAINQKNELNKSFYELLEQKNEEQRVFAHDIKHHLFAIDSMDNLSEIKKYIKEIQPKLETYQFIGKTDNKMFDLILNKYYMLAKRNGIVFNTDIRSSNLCFVEDSDLVSLLGNLLDNAFEAIKESKNKEVTLTTSNDNNFILLSIVNSCPFSPVVDNDKLITTKNDKKYHGYGTKSIEKTAEKYNGICQWNYDKNKKEFHYNILFNK